MPDDSKLKILVGCEFSGRVREAFRNRGHEAYSCDLLPSEIPSKYHIQKDVLELAYNEQWEMGIFFPPCTYLAVSGARWFKDRIKEQKEAVNFVRALWNSPIEKIAIENPVGVLSTQFRKPDQIIQPWQFGVSETKATCLWLKNIPELVPTEIIPESKRNHSIWYESPGKDRAKNRSRTFQGIADAISEQWS